MSEKENYINLIKKYGTKKALEMLEESGMVYDEDFTHTHRTDPIFSNPNTMISKMKNISEIEIMTVQNRVDGNVYPFQHISMGVDNLKSKFTNSLFNLTVCVLLEDNYLEQVITDSGNSGSVSQYEINVTK